LKTFLKVLFIAFTALLIWAIDKKPISESSTFFFEDPWGIVALADLYIGFMIFSMMVFLVEKSKLTALAWTLPLFVLGNCVSLAYVIFNFKKIFRKLSS
jgi:hypothetical protein